MEKYFKQTIELIQSYQKDYHETSQTLKQMIKTINMNSYETKQFIDNQKFPYIQNSFQDFNHYILENASEISHRLEKQVTNLVENYNFLNSSKYRLKNLLNFVFQRQKSFHNIYVYVQNENEKIFKEYYRANKDQSKDNQNHFHEFYHKNISNEYKVKKQECEDIINNTQKQVDQVLNEIELFLFDQKKVFQKTFQSHHTRVHFNKFNGQKLDDYHQNIVESVIADKHYVELPQDLQLKLQRESRFTVYQDKKKFRDSSHNRNDDQNQVRNSSNNKRPKSQIKYQ